MWESFCVAKVPEKYLYKINLPSESEPAGLESPYKTIKFHLRLKSKYSLRENMYLMGKPTTKYNYLQSPIYEIFSFFQITNQTNIYIHPHSHTHIYVCVCVWERESEWSVLTHLLYIMTSASHCWPQISVSFGGATVISSPGVRMPRK